MKPHRHASWLWAELSKRRGIFAAALLCTAASAGLYLLMPVWASRLVGEVFASGDIGWLALYLVLGIGLFTVASMLSFGRIYLMTRLSFSITADTRERLFGQILHASPRSLVSVGGGQLVSSFSNDLQTLQEALVRVVAQLAPSVIMIVVFAGAMAWYSWLLFLCSAVLISPLAWVTSYFGRKLHGAAHTTQDRLAGLVARFEEMLGGAKEIKSFNREDDVLDRFRRLNAETLEAQLTRERTSSFYPFAVALAASVGIGGMIMIAAVLLGRGLITLQTLTSFLVCVGIAYSPLQEASNSIGRLVQLVAILDRLERLAGLPRERGGSRPLGAVSGAIDFEHVDFAYAPGGFRLTDFNLRIPAGQRIALVGPSGGGKSTIVDFVPRFLTPDGGRLLIDGIDAAALDLPALRREVGVVFQQPVLFEGTLADNLRFGAPNATDEEVRAAAAAGHVDEFARRLPAGYGTRIEPRGANLSVGQRQRIAIARVFLKNPRILVLDEPTSALDAESERLVRDALERASEGRTTLIVAHRLSTIRAADRIVVIERGTIVEDGTHEGLVRAGGLYQKLCEEQFEKEDDS